MLKARVLPASKLTSEAVFFESLQGGELLKFKNASCIDSINKLIEYPIYSLCITPLLSIA